MLEQLHNLLARQVGPNTAQEILLAFGVFVILFAAFKLFQVLILVRLRRVAESSDNKLDDKLVEMVDGIHGWFYFVLALFVALRGLTLDPTVDKVIFGIFLVAVVYEGIRSLERLFHYLLQEYVAKGDKQETAAIHGLELLIKIVLWATGVLLILANLGVEVNSLIASLGIGGIAVALAVQNILGDIFSSFSLYLDKPFQVGDFIVVGEYMGVVKKIGIKTTRIQALQGEEIVVANNELTSARIQNFKKLRKRRVVMTFGLVYATTTAKLKKANEIVKKTIDDIDLLEFDRCNFFEFGDFSLNFELVFYVDTADYAEYMNLREQMNFAIKDGFAKAKIEMAFPTQTVFVEK